MNTFFTSPPLLRLLKEMRIATAKIVQINRVEKAPLKSVKVMNAGKYGPE